MQSIDIGNFRIGKGEPLTFLCGPCVIEGEDFSLRIAEKIKNIFKPLHANLIFKSSFDKANRSSVHSYRGPGLDEGCRILSRVRDELGLPVVTDIHQAEQAEICAESCDMLQIPAFLCRQTDLLTAAARTGLPLNVKKAQFMAPWDMKAVVEKVRSEGNEKIILCDRGTCFGYNTLVSDFRGLSIMADLGYPICFDATHSVQQPGGRGDSSGGQREFVPLLARAAVAVGCQVVFMEVHPNPEQAKSDSASQLALEELEDLVVSLIKIHDAINSTVPCLGGK